MFRLLAMSCTVWAAVVCSDIIASSIELAAASIGFGVADEVVAAMVVVQLLRDGVFWFFGLVLVKKAVIFVSGDMAT